jgi:hypothetical protein
MMRSPSQCPWHGPILDLGGALGDHDPVGDLPTGLETAAWASLRPPAAKAAVQLPAQLTTALNEQRLIDRLVAHLHHRIVRILGAQAVRDLLGRPPLFEPRGDLSCQFGTGELGRLRPSCPMPGLLVRIDRPIASPATVGGHLTRHRRDRPADGGRHLGEGLAALNPDADLLSICARQARRRGVPRQRGGRLTTQHVHHCVPGALHHPADLTKTVPLREKPMDFPFNLWVQPLHYGPPRWA